MKNAICTLVILALICVLVAAPATAATKVFLLGGQSNMAGVGGYDGVGYGLPADQPCPYPYNVPQTAVKFWNYGPAAQPDPSSGINTPGVGTGWVPTAPGYGHEPENFGPEVSFGYRLHEIFPGDDIYLVKEGFTSTDLAHYWNPDGSGSFYNTLESRVHAAMANLTAAGKSPTIVGMIWMQGESDAMVHEKAAAYEANLTNLITELRSDFYKPNTPNMRFVVGRITDYYEWGTPDDNALVRNAQMTVPRDVGNASWIDTDDLQWAYAGHYGTQGQIDLGTRFADEFIVPEPSSLALAGTGLLLLIGYGWRKRAIVVRKCFLAAVVAILGLTASVGSAAPVRIMCVGDSLTAGNTNAPTWTVPFTFGYRGPLYTKLTGAGYNVQFVGTSGEPWNLPYGEALGVPTTIQGPDLRPLGQDNHRGYAGVTTNQLLNGGHAGGATNNFPSIGEMVTADNPDVVLLMIGTNNYSDPPAASDLNSLVNQIVTTKPDAKVIVAQIPPRSTYQQSLVDYNTYIRDTLVPFYQSHDKHVTTVDQYANLLVNKNDLTSIDTNLYCDSAHLKPLANERLAQTWLTGIEAVVSVPEPSSLSMLVILALGLVGPAFWHVRRRREIVSE